MFEFLRRRRAPDHAGEIRRQFKDAEQAIGMKWQSFVATVHLESEISLAVEFNILRQLFQQFASTATLCASTAVDELRRRSIHQ
jgi:hypothetical protein